MELIMSKKIFVRKTEFHTVEFDPTTYTYVFRKGNIKLGKSGKLVTWSTLMSDKDIFIPNLGYSIKGTCPKGCTCAPNCYVKKSYNRFPLSSPFGHAKNTLGLRTCPDKVFADLNKQLVNNENNKNIKNKIKIVRINQSGDIETEYELYSWCELAKKHPKIKFYLYTKNYAVAEECIINGYVGGLPDNFHILYSIWQNNGVKEFERVKNYRNVHAFIYSDGKEGISTTNYCPAYDKKGKMNHKYTCETCGKCFSKAAINKMVACFDH